MTRPGDGDGSSSEDGLIAEIIPLRRREPGETREAAYDPPPSKVFDPPRDPEPPGEYSVWETPTAELLRREPPRTRASGVGRWFKAPRSARGYRWLALVALAAVGLSVIALIAVLPGRRGPSPLAVGQLPSSPGLGQALGGVTTSWPRPRQREKSASHRRPRYHASVAAAGRHASRGPRTPAPDRVAPSGTASASVTYPGTASPSPTSVNGQRGNAPGAPVIATAAREFGFER